MDLLLWAFLGTPVLLGLGWRDWYVPREPDIRLWRSRATLIALSALTINAAVFYGWWSVALLSGGSERMGAVKAFLADNVTMYLAFAALVPAALGKGTSRICAIIAALCEVVLWSNIGV